MCTSQRRKPPVTCRTSTFLLPRAGIVEAWTWLFDLSYSSNPCIGVRTFWSSISRKRWRYGLSARPIHSPFIDGVQISPRFWSKGGRGSAPMIFQCLRKTQSHERDFLLWAEATRVGNTNQCKQLCASHIPKTCFWKLSWTELLGQSQNTDSEGRLNLPLFGPTPNEQLFNSLSIMRFVTLVGSTLLVNG